MCGQNGCKEVHHRLLHKEAQSLSQTNVTRPNTFEQIDKVEKDVITDGVKPLKVEGSIEGEQELSEQRAKQHDTTMVIGTTGNIALRTVPVYLKNGNKRLQVNALLDDASTKTYINADVAAELGLQGCLQKANVSVLNGKVETFETSPVECVIESLDGKAQSKITAFTANRVTGSMKAIDWKVCAKRWPHLEGLPFHKLGSRPIVDILIGLDCAELHFSFKDVRGKPGQPVARLTPLGWTCIGAIEDEQHDSITTNFVRTYFVVGQTDLNKVNATLRKFWEIDSSGTENPPVLTSEDEAILQKAQQSIRFVNGHYKIAIPWKQDKVILPDNYSMALSWLQSLEKCLAKNPEVAKTYQEVIDKHLEKGYIREVDNLEKPITTWYLPHFAVVKTDRPSTKMRIVYDASARYCGVCLNDVIHQGPKLQQELFNVLMRFRRYPVALVCDIAEMYLRKELYPEDKSFH